MTRLWYDVMWSHLPKSKSPSSPISVSVIKERRVGWPGRDVGSGCDMIVLGFQNFGFGRSSCHSIAQPNRTLLPRLPFPWKESVMRVTSEERREEERRRSSIICNDTFCFEISELIRGKEKWERWDGLERLGFWCLKNELERYAFEGRKSWIFVRMKHSVKPESLCIIFVGQNLNSDFTVWIKNQDSCSNTSNTTNLNEVVSKHHNAFSPFWDKMGKDYASCVINRQTGEGKGRSFSNWQGIRNLTPLDNLIRKIRWPSPSLLFRYLTLNP